MGMKTINNIPTSKVQRATKLVGTGAKVGVNYLKYIGDKIINSEEEAKEKLNQNNAEDIYNSLKQLKGSALKVAQMLSMDKSIMPQAYVKNFLYLSSQFRRYRHLLLIEHFVNILGLAQVKFLTNSTSLQSMLRVSARYTRQKKWEKLAVKIQYLEWLKVFPQILNWSSLLLLKCLISKEKILINTFKRLKINLLRKLITI